MKNLLAMCTPLNGCCGVAIISGMWRDKLPDPVRAAVASLKLSGTEFETTIKKADDVFLALNTAKMQVSAVTEDIDTAATGASTASGIAALSTRGLNQKGRGKGRGKGGPARGAKANTSASSAKPQKHSDNPPDGVCDQHFKFGKGA